MKFITVVETQSYLAKAEKLMNDDDRQAVVNQLAADPEDGDVIPGGGGVRKIRIPLQGRGKRGGARVIYFFYTESIPPSSCWTCSPRTRKKTSQQLTWRNSPPWQKRL